MEKAKEQFKEYVREWMENCRSEKDYSVDRMSEALLEESRSYSDQKSGKIGFSGITICRMLLQLSESERGEFIRGLQTNVWPEEFEEEGRR